NAFFRPAGPLSVSTTSFFSGPYDPSTWTSISASDATIKGAVGPTPAPDSFQTQSSTASVQYLGDKYLFGNLNNTAKPYAKTVADIYTITTPTATSYQLSWETSGYQDTALTNGQTAFRGFVMGPSYWGKSFYIWPPCPASAVSDANPTLTSAPSP